MHLLITTFGFLPEAHGVAHVAFKHAEALTRRGHRVCVATGFHPGRPGRSIIPPGIEVVQFRVTGNAHPRSRYRGEIENYVDFVRAFPGDLICCHCWQTWSTDLAVRGFGGNPARKVLVSHGVSANSRWGWPLRFPDWLLWRPYVLREMPRMLRAFDHVVFLSRRTDSDRFYDRKLALRAGYRSHSVIPNGADLQDPGAGDAGFKTRHGIRSRRMVLCVGNYSRLKNERMVLDAFIRSGLRDTTLVMIGGGANRYMGRLQEEWRRKREGLPGEVCFLWGLSEEEIRSAYRAADMFASGSRTECFPLVILDAMGAGTPFLSTDVGCIADLPGGRTVACARDMAEEMRRMMDCPREREAMGRRGQEAVRIRYNWEAVADRYERLFQRLTGRP
ncbi:glycosyltransferase family 4 protein [Desulfococcus sp.]|uniref:glycosyltransferase family 4 protein n=1 Tax=Desulfococcus sp. TaxID=2025834 RepID=UPI003593247F